VHKNFSAEGGIVQGGWVVGAAVVWALEEWSAMVDSVACFTKLFQGNAPYELLRRADTYGLNVSAEYGNCPFFEVDCQ
jgi:hypothetical protein